MAKIYTVACIGTLKGLLLCRYFLRGPKYVIILKWNSFIIIISMHYNAQLNLAQDPQTDFLEIVVYVSGVIGICQTG